MRKLLYILLVLLISCEEIDAAGYYISPAGSDVSGTGSQTNPWRTLGYAVTRVTSGDVINVFVGSYSITSPISIPVGVSLVGVNGIPEFICSYNGVCLTLSSAEGVNGSQSISYIAFTGSYPSGTYNLGIEVVGRSNVHIHDCEFTNFYRGAVSFYGKAGKAGGYPGIYPTGNKFYNNTVYNCAGTIGGEAYGNLRIGGQEDMEIYGNSITQGDRGPNLNGFGIKFAAKGLCKGLKIYDNTIRVPAIESGDSWDFAMEIWNSRGGLEIYDNVIQGTVDIGCDSTIDDHIALNDAGGYGFAMRFHGNSVGQSSLNYESESGIDIERNVTGGTYIFNNYFHNLKYPIRSSMNDPGEVQEDVFIYYNIISGVGAGEGGGRGMMIPYRPNNSAFNNWGIWNNVIYAGPSGNPLQGIYFRVTTGSNISIKNNIIMGFDYPIYFQGGTISTLYTDKNIAYDNSTNAIYNNGCNIIDGVQNGNIVVDPEFVLEGRDFRLSSTSPAINAGVSVGLTYDYAEAPVGDPPEIGVYEYGTSVLTVPTVVTSSISNIDLSTADGGGNVTNSGGSSVTARGVCWSTSPNPTTSNSHTSDGTGTGVFTSSITGLEGGVTYYVRAYATNTQGTAYGSNVSFTSGETVSGAKVVMYNGRVVMYNGKIVKY